MPIFKFFINRKVVEWYRDSYSITAENQNIANLIMKEVLRDNPEIEGLIVHDSTDPIDGTMEDETPNELGDPTKELFSLNEQGNDTFIESNGHQKVRRR